jgi:hypothetical protein
MTSQAGRSFVAALCSAVVGASATAFADPIKCERGLAKASAKYVQGRTKALDKCELGKTKGQFLPSTVCTSEPKAAATIATAGTKLASSIAKACGGADKICGAGGDDDSLASIGWGSVSNCPDFESSGCTNAINNCADISTCLLCIHSVAVDQALATYYGGFQQSEYGTNSTVNKCQQAIGKSTSKFIVARSKALQKCWDLRLKSVHTNSCPNPGEPAGKTMLLISKAETKKVTSICKACGGTDKLCGGAADLTPGAYGFSGTCPAVTTYEPSAARARSSTRRTRRLCRSSPPSTDCRTGSRCRSS